MLRKTAGVMVALLLCAGTWGGAAAAAVDQAAMDKAFSDLPAYDWGQSRDPLNKIDEAIVQTHGKAAARKGIEKRLCAVLANAKATRAAKQYCCRKLAIIGTADSVDALAPLLTSQELSHMARYALERMTFPQAVQAMRDALGKVSGKLKVGMINSLGVRGDAASVGKLTPLLKSSDKQVAGAAAAALGKIAADQAAGPLTAFYAGAPKELKGTAIDALLDFAQRQVKKGNAPAAVKIYDTFYAKGQPSRVRRAAFQGLCMARPAQSTTLVLDALSSADPAFRGLAVQMIKEMPGTRATRAFAAHLGKLPPAGQIGLLDALAARKDPAARPAVLKAADSGSPDVKVAAIRALGSVGGAADVAMLAKTAAANAKGTGEAARASLASLPGKDVNRRIVSALAGGSAAVKVELIRALAARVASETADDVARHAGAADTNVRRAAIEALGQIGGLKQLPMLIAMAKKPKDAGDRGTIEKALLAVCSGVKEKAAGDLIAGIRGADSDAHVILLNALARAGGARALDAVVAGTKSADGKVKDGAIRVLGAWQDPAAIDPLLAIASSSASEVHQVLALRGVVNLARMRSTKTDVKFRALSKALALAKKTREKRMVIGAMRDVPTVAAFKLVVPFLDDASLAQEACTAAVGIARSDRVHRAEPDFVRAAMEKVLKIARNNRTKRDAQWVLGRVKPKQR